MATPPDPDTTGIFDIRAAAPVYGETPGGRATRIVERRADPNASKASWQTGPVRLIVSQPSSPTDLRTTEQPAPPMAQHENNDQPLPDWQSISVRWRESGPDDGDRAEVVAQGSKAESTSAPAINPGPVALRHLRHLQEEACPATSRFNRPEQERQAGPDGAALITPKQDPLLIGIGSGNLWGISLKVQAKDSVFLGPRPLHSPDPPWHMTPPSLASILLLDNELYLSTRKPPAPSRSGGISLAGIINTPDGLQRRLPASACEDRRTIRAKLGLNQYSLSLLDKAYRRWGRSPSVFSLRDPEPSEYAESHTSGPSGLMRPPPLPNRAVSRRSATASDSGYGSVTSGCMRCGRPFGDQHADPKVAITAPLCCEQTPPASTSGSQTVNIDTVTVYSDTGSLSGDRINGCIEKLADGLFHNLVGRGEGHRASYGAVHGILRAFPEMLKYFALDFAYTGTSQKLLNIMYFVYMNHIAITSAVRSRCISMSDRGETGQVKRDFGTCSLDRVHGWLDSAHRTVDWEPQEPAEHSSDGINPHEEIEEDGIIQETAEYTKPMTTSDVYASFLAHARTEASMAQHDTINIIRRTMTSTLPHFRQRISRYRPLKICTVTLTVNWEPFTFLAEQGYAGPPDEAIANAITVTGSRMDAQATTVAQYLAQTWPCTGHAILSKIQELIRGEQVARGVLRENTTFEASFEHDPMTRLVVGIQGTPESVVQAAQVLSWLGAALRCSRSTDQPEAVQSAAHIQVASTPSPDAESKMEYEIFFDYTELSDLPARRGQCWHGLFRNLAVVKGFPIPHRPLAGLGLEIPLNMMAALAGSSRLDLFDAKFFIKGFSTMLVPTLRDGNIVVWHFIEKGEERVSYLDWGHEHVDLTMSEIETARHIVGWCSEVTYDVGAAGASYDVRRSLLPVAHAGCVLERAQISGGQLIHGSITFAVGSREKPIHVSREGYIPKLKWAAGKYVILWDEEARRGWLVNGASALLHLLRASLEHSGKDKFKRAFLFGKADFVEAQGPNNADSAIDMLMDERNRRLRLYSERSEIVQSETSTGKASEGQISATRTSKFYCVQDRVEHLYGILEKMIDHQTAVERRNGVQMPEWPRRQLEGWDFHEVYADRDPLYPRVAILNSIGKGWVDFTRGIHAITLFGRGFGDLMRPGDKSAVAGCARWSTLPWGGCYLAATVSDLMDIMRVDGDPDSNPRKLSEKLLWHSKDNCFSPCPCGSSKAATKGGIGLEKKHSDPVQTLFPSRFWTKLKKKAQVELPCRGAVVFGHNWSMHWHYGDSGDPQRGDPPSTAEEEYLEEALVSRPRADSGLGSSLLSNTSSNSQDYSSSDNPQPEPSEGSSRSGFGTAKGVGTRQLMDHDLGPKDNDSDDDQEATSRGFKRRLAHMAPSLKKTKRRARWRRSGVE